MMRTIKMTLTAPLMSLYLQGMARQIVLTYIGTKINNMKAKSIAVLILFIINLNAGATPIDQMLERIDKGASKKFKIELRNDHRQTTDYFELDQQGQRVVVRANNWISAAVGINWYLKHHAGIHLSWNQMRATLPANLPKVSKKERHETDLTLRYDFNYCTFSYSMPFWDWRRWEQEIDWMALHGVNLPLAIVGEECVWHNMLLKMGYTEEEVGRFIAGPAFLAWWEMNNLEGWGGPLPLSWYQRQEGLQKKILKRMREYGMHPVLPGYCGMVPHDARERLGLNVADAGLWNGFQRPANLLSTDPRFKEIATLYYQELTKLFGTSKYYSMDPFHESNDDSAIDYAAAGKVMMDAMKQVRKDAVWVIQGWTENPRPEMIDAMDNGDLLVLDLFSECRPMFGIPSIWKREKGYKQHNWLFCMLENFGANVGLHGRMDQLLHNFSLARQQYGAHLKGIGFTMEGSMNNPVMFELMSELPWRQETVTKEQWIKEYIRARYGLNDIENATVLHEIESAWDILIHSIYNCPAGNNQQGPHESIFCGRPSLNNFQASSWSKMKNYYDPDATLKAAEILVEVADRMRGSNNFEYDLVDICRQAVADQARIQYLETIADYHAFRRKAFQRDSQRFLDLLLLQDELLATRSEFKVGRWIEEARKAGDTSAEKDLYEWNARVQITTWGNRYCADTGGLRDYAHKEWSGLLKDFYYKRWKCYFEALDHQLVIGSQEQPDMLGGGANANKTASELFAMALPQDVKIDYYAMEEPWTKTHNSYSSQAEGDAIEVAQRVVEILKR